MNENKISKNVGIYIHIPFCKHKCYYCDFLSFENSQNINGYFECLKKEILSFSEELNQEVKIKTIYIGGGTPSYVDSKYIKELVSLIKQQYTLNQDAEITIEINPGTVNEEKLQDYFDIGINRVSIGMQSTDNKLLKNIGRIHSYGEFLTVYKLARKVGFKNINVDLMFGLPEQTLEILKDSIEKIIELNPEHISTYSLIIEEGTKLKEMIEQKQYKVLEDEVDRKMYWEIKNILESKGYKHYEISNFAKIGYESKHNIDCWNQQEYVGFGIGAHSYTDKVRYSNTNDVNEYIENININKEEDNIRIHEKQNDMDTIKEYMLLKLRLIDGINIEEFEKKFGIHPCKIFKKEIEKLVREEYLVVKNESILLSNKGIDFANCVWKEFI